MDFKKTMSRLSAIIFLCLLTDFANAANKVINLTVDYKTVNFTGKPAKAIAVNNQIPGPTLHFKEGDHVTLNVYNHLKVGTSIHWHGLLVPWQMDGVAGISQLAIPPGGVFHYRFTLQQSGTYWYHAHEEFQEQQGLYGGIVIDPRTPPSYHTNKDFVVVLSDWNNASPEKVYANLKKEGDYYTPRFPLQPSLMKFIHDYKKASSQGKKQLIADYKMMQQMRMSIYDFSDVAYDAYLLNGQTEKNPWTALVNIGDVVRLRFINAGGSTIYNVKIPHSLMKIVQIDGNNIKPVTVKKFSISPGETYDVLVSIKKSNPYIIYAESIDTLGHAIGIMMTKPHQFVDYQSIKPFPEPQPVTREMMRNMMSTGDSHYSMPSSNDKTNHSTHQKMKNNGEMTHHHTSHQMTHTNHQSSHNMKEMNHSMQMATESQLQGDSIVSLKTLPDAKTTTSTKYQSIVAAVKTNNPNKPIKGVIRMELFGYMDRYIWFINGVPGYKAKPIVLKPGKRYRIIFTNTSMMHHPMHIHGHWFILRNGHGAYDPLGESANAPESVIQKTIGAKAGRLYCKNA